MKENSMIEYLKEMLGNLPSDWLNLTTHRLDIYNEKLAKTEFLEEFEALFNANDFSPSSLEVLPTAFDYIRLGHPLSCILEWTVGNLNGTPHESVISFSSSTIPILAILRKNLLIGKKTRILHLDGTLSEFDQDTVRRVYGYNFELMEVEKDDFISDFDGSTILVTQQEDLCHFDFSENIDFYINIHPQLGSIILVKGEVNESYISEIQHVRRRESIAMTPSNCLIALETLVLGAPSEKKEYRSKSDKAAVLELIQNITDTKTKALLGSSGLSIQYAIMMGVVDDAIESHPGKDIKIIVPTNCYGGTNDQARRVAACLENVEVVDLAVDGGNDMVQSLEKVLQDIAQQDALAYIIAEIPTNPRVEVPELLQLKEILSQERSTKSGSIAVAPVFILDQTFCPNVHFLGEGEILSTVRSISYSSCSKFPSGGLCTAGYCIGNSLSDSLMEKVEKHLQLCDNEATSLQLEILAKQMPSMKERIQGAYNNTREFVNYIQETLPKAKINFVSEELAAEGFTPSVFSLDLPTKGDSDEERETYKRALNHRLIKMMITEIPNESKYCVSYGQLKGCYWTIPATSTQGTTKEGDKDYIARVALSAKMDLAKHKEVFAKFVEGL